MFHGAYAPSMHMHLFFNITTVSFIFFDIHRQRVEDIISYTNAK